MATQALYRKWRSQSFDEVVGQQHVTQTLQNAIELDRVAHAYLFTGPRGTGKTSTARILAKAVNCIGSGPKPCNECSICVAITEGRLMDLIEIDAASNTSVDDIRDLRDKVDFRPAEARIKFYIIDEVHMLSRSAFNALLKTLEEPPPHVIFVLATTEPEKIPATITSRCQRFDFRRIRLEDVVEHLRFILEREGLQAETDALALIARQGSGSMRDSISLLDQLTSYGQATISLELVRSVLGGANTTASQTLVDHLLSGEAGEGLKLLNEIMGNGVDPRQFTIEIVEYLRSLLLVKYGNGPQFLGLPAEAIQIMEAQAATVSAQKLLQLTERFNQAIREFRAGAGEISIPHLPLELAFVQMALAEEPLARSGVVTTDQLVSSPPILSPTKAPPSPEPKPAPVERTAPSPAVVGELTIEQLRDRWHELLEEVTRRKVPSNYLKRPMVADVGLENHTVVIYFDKTYERAYERADKLKDTIIDAFQAVLGAAWVVDLRLSSAKGVPDHTPAEASDTTAEKKTNVTPPNYESDPLVKSALDLGGKIKGTRSLPEATD